MHVCMSEWASEKSTTLCITFHTGITFTSEPMDVTVCETETAVFHCQYEGSLALPTWNINSIIYSIITLPPRHFIARESLFVINSTLRQNSTLYQCQIISMTNNRQVCAYRSAVGWLVVINCTRITSGV